MSYSRMLSLFCFSSILASCTLAGYHLFPSQALADQDATDIARLVKQLGSDSFQERESAMEALRRIGRSALPALRAAQSSSDGEIRRRARTLVRELDVGIQPLLDRKATIVFSGNQKPSPISVLNVSMVGSAFGDDDLINVREFTNMQTLDLCCTRITNAGLARIEHLSNLQKLFLHRTDVSDLTSIRKLTKLTHLYLGSTRITDEKLAPIKDLTDLWCLILGDTKVSDSGLVHLVQSKNLHQLELPNTKITDKGLVHLKGLKELTRLNLDGTEVTNAGLVHLNELKKLRFLSLYKTKATAKGIEELKKSLPEWENYRDELLNAKK